MVATRHGMRPMISFQQVNQTYDNGVSYVIKNLSLSVANGEVLAILGSSGSGKSTLLKMVNKLIIPSSGTVLIDQQDIADMDSIQLRRNIGYVIQDSGLFPHMTVKENIGLPLRLQQIPSDQQLEKIKEKMAFVNLSFEHFSDRYPDELSGGQQQRVGVARALINNPDYILMDEPFGALDSINRDQLQADFKQLQQRLKKTVMIVTHDVVEAFRLADRIAIMSQGELQQVGTRHEIMNHPANDFVKNLFQQPAEQMAMFTDYMI